ncbi:MAG: glycosyltransferase [Deltaproteobacteria bacterium]|nr:glycosyltransferase [Deltaproteobacteria bacterium]
MSQPPPITREPVAAAAGSPRVLVFTTLFPNPLQPMRGIFVRHRVAAMARHCPTRVVAPILHRGWRWPGDADREQQDALPVSHPRYTTVPLLARAADGALLYRQVLPHVRSLHAEFPFTVIDAHYAFPDGAAAIRLGAHFRVPVAVTVRGGDLELLTRSRLRRRAIAHTLQRADRVFAVSEHLAACAIGLGAAPAAVRVVRNGVDARFTYGERDAARRALALPAAAPLLVCVANLLADKGQHVLVEALARLGGGDGAPQLVLIGSDRSPRQAYRRRLERLIATHGLGARVRLLGGLDQALLPQWYRAADLLVLATFREGAPNVVREALACGTPVVASRVGGVPELIPSDDLGILVAPGDSAALARSLASGLRREWDRPAIAARVAGRDWQSAGDVVAAELARLVAARRD